MKKSNFKDLKRRMNVQRYEHQRVALKAIQNHLKFPIKKRFFALIQLSKIKRNSSRVRVKNRCVLTGRSRGIFNYFKISRILIRDLAAKGLLSGLKKASW